MDFLLWAAGRLEAHGQTFSADLDDHILGACLEAPEFTAVALPGARLFAVAHPLLNATRELEALRCARAAAGEALGHALATAQGEVFARGAAAREMGSARACRLPPMGASGKGLLLAAVEATAADRRLAAQQRRVEGLRAEAAATADRLEALLAWWDGGRVGGRRAFLQSVGRTL